MLTNIGDEEMFSRLVIIGILLLSNVASAQDLERDPKQMRYEVWSQVSNLRVRVSEAYSIYIAYMDRAKYELSTEPVKSKAVSLGNVFGIISRHLFRISEQFDQMPDKGSSWGICAGSLGLLAFNLESTLKDGDPNDIPVLVAGFNKRLNQCQQILGSLGRY